MPRKTQGPSKKKSKVNVPVEKENTAPAEAAASLTNATAVVEVSGPDIKDKNTSVVEESQAPATALVLSADEAKSIV